MLRLKDIPTTEYDNYFRLYVSYNDPSLTIDEALAASEAGIINYYHSLSSDQLTQPYAPGKWTPLDVLQHLMDAERVFAYRALRFGRGDTTALPGFEQDDYVATAGATQQSLDTLLGDYRSLRTDSRRLFRSFDSNALARSGSASGNSMSVRALSFVIAGHDLHHLKIFRETLG